jgi:hypothetical protein
VSETGGLSVDAAKGLGIRLRDCWWTIMLGIVLRLRLRVVRVPRAIVRGRLLVSSGAPYEELIVLAGRIAVPSSARVLMTGSTLIVSVPIVGGLRRLAIGGLVCGGCASARVRDIGVIVAMPVSVVRHGGANGLYNCVPFSYSRCVC